MNPDPVAWNNLKQIARSQQLARDLCSLVKWKENERCMDIGCGSGEVTSTTVRQFLGNESHMVGVDVVPRTIDLAKANNSLGDKLQYQVADITDRSTLLPEWTGYFDKILSIQCLHHVADIRATFKNIFHLLTSGGEFAATFIGTCALWNDYGVFTKNEKWKKYFEDKKMHHPEWAFLTRDKRLEFFKKLIEDTGLELLFCREESDDLRFSEAEFRLTMQAACPLQFHLPEDKRPVFLDECSDLLRPIWGTEDGNFMYKIEQLTIHTKKL